MKLDLIGEHYLLIPFREEHISERYIGWLNDPQVNRFLEVRFVHQTHETVLHYIRSFARTDEKFLWGIYERATNELVGTASLYHVSSIHQSAEVSLMIGNRDHWGRPASTETMTLIAEFVFERLKFRRLSGGSYATNHAMNFTFKRLGFTCEGKLRQACMVAPGQYVDAFRWAIFADEWRDRQRHARSIAS